MLGNYTEQTLAKLHTVILDALKEFDRVCRKYDITYFVGFGTAIGAVRHQGFIPWDDDVDVCMMREEYEKLRAVPCDEWDDRYFLTDPRDDYKMHRTLFPCMFIKGTAFETEGQIKLFKTDGEESYPIHIDIFLFDSFEQSKLSKMIKKVDNFKRLVLYSKCKFNVVKTDSLKAKTVCRVKRMMSTLLKVTGNTSEKIYQRYLRFLKKNTGDHVSSFELVETYEKIKFVSTYDEMFPVVYLPFEDMQVPMQKNYHEIMTRLYGDYMAMPPLEKRWNAAPIILDLGDGKGNIMGKGDVEND